MMLAGDIGGTHTRLALFDGDSHEPLALTIYPSRKHAGLEEIVAAFLAKHPADLDGACFDVAGPVRNGRVKTTNLPWIVDARQVADNIGLPSVELVNDLAATAYGIAELTPADLETLRSGDPAIGGNLAVIAAGTGLGEAGLIWDGKRYHDGSLRNFREFGVRASPENKASGRAVFILNEGNTVFKRLSSDPLSVDDWPSDQELRMEWSKLD